jgi:hypothetical protein
MISHPEPSLSESGMHVATSLGVLSLDVQAETSSAKKGSSKATMR